MSVKFTAELHILNVDGKETEKDMSLVIEENDDDGLDLVFFDDVEKKLTLSLDKDELVEAICRVAGGEIRMVAKED